MYTCCEGKKKPQNISPWSEMLKRIKPEQHTLDPLNLTCCSITHRKQKLQIFAQAGTYS